MKYIRINTNQGTVFINPRAKEAYSFSLSAPKLFSWTNIVSLVCAFALFSIPYLYQLQFNTKVVIVLLIFITATICICLFFSMESLEKRCDFLILTGAVQKHDDAYTFTKPFKKQVVKNILLSFLTIILLSFFAFISLWLIKNGSPIDYGGLFCVFCSWPLMIIFLVAFRPIGTWIDYLRFSSVVNTGDGSLCSDKTPQ